MSSKKKIEIKVEGLHVCYGDHKVLDDLSFTLNENEFFVLVGKSGSGKSTLLKAITNLVDYKGSIQMANHAVLVFQEDRLLPWLKVKDNIRLGFNYYQNNHIKQSKISRKEIKDKIRHISESLRISQLLNKYPDQISGGEKQRVSIARAFVAEPAFILMDEALKSLDIFTKEMIYEWLMDYFSTTNSTIIYVTHDLEEALLLGDRVALLCGGKIIQELRVPFNRPRNNEIKYTDEFNEHRKHMASLFN